MLGVKQGRARLAVALIMTSAGGWGCQSEEAFRASTLMQCSAEPGLVDVSTNPEHCGGCNVACGNDDTCEEGRCVADPNWALWSVSGGQPSFSRRDDVVEDATTGLVWEAGFSPLVDYDAAERYCGDLRLDGRHFRVPTRIELASILDYSGGSPAIVRAAFPETPAAQFWHRPMHDHGGDSIDLADLSSGFGESHVRCVAVDPDAAVMGPHYSLEGATFVDLKTNLRWQREATPAPPGGTVWSEPGNGSYDFADAQRYCAALELGGRGDWRVPSVLELLSLADPDDTRPVASRRANAHLDSSVIPPETFEQPVFYARAVVGAEDVPWSVDFIRDLWPASRGESARRTLCVTSADESGD